MGYDMTVVNELGQELEGEENYWRRNMAGGYQQAVRLVEAGLGYWPVDPDFLKELWPACECDLDDTCPVCNRHRRRTGNERPGISVYKLCHSNDGWWVTRAECTSALRLWEGAGRPDVDNGLGDAIPFLQQAARHHGFKVW